MKSIEICIRNARQDEKLLQELERHLKPLAWEKQLEIYHDGKIPLGEKYEEQMTIFMQAAHIIIALLSSDFMGLPAYVEVEQALRYSRQTGTRVIPILVRPCDWRSGSLGQLKILPRNEVPVKVWRDRDRAWTEVVQHIRVVAELIRKIYGDEEFL